MGFILFVINFIVLSVLAEIFFKKDEFVVDTGERIMAYSVITLVSLFGQVTTTCLVFAAFVWCCIKFAKWVAQKVVK